MEKYIAENYQDIAENLLAQIKDFLIHHTQYPTDVVVGICDKTRNIKLDSPQKLAPEYKQYSIADFILINEKGLYEPDINMIFGN